MSKLPPKLRNGAIAITALLVIALGWDAVNFLRANANGEANAYVGYLRGVPILWKSVATNKLDDAMFEDACDADTVEAYREYLRRSPRKLHQEEAVGREDESLYTWAKSVGTVQAFCRYVDELPSGRRHDEVESALYLAASESGSIGLVREYLKRFPVGRYHEVAAAEIHGISDQAFAGYQAIAANNGAERRALDTMLAVAGFINETDRRVLQITYKAIDSTGIPTVSGHDWRTDETRATEEIEAAFGKMFQTDVMRIVRVGAREPDMLGLHVEYSLVKTGRSYSADNGVPTGFGARREFEGVRFDWSFRLIIPSDPPLEYSFDFSTDPATHFTVTYESSPYGGLDTGPPTSVVYKAMIETAFTDFQAEFMRRFGF